MDVVMGAGGNLPFSQPLSKTKIPTSIKHNNNTLFYKF